MKSMLLKAAFGAVLVSFCLLAKTRHEKKRAMIHSHTFYSSLLKPAQSTQLAFKVRHDNCTSGRNA